MSPTLASLVRHVRGLDDVALLDGLAEVKRKSDELLAVLLVHLVEVEDRMLYAEQGLPSMHAYCTTVLNFSDSAAGKRLRVARLGRRLPLLVDMVAAGQLHLSGLVAMASCLTEVP